MKMLPLLIAAAPLAPALADDGIAPIAGTRLVVSAEGRSTRRPDLATISAAVVTEAGTAAKAMADNAGRTTAVIAALRRAGVTDRDMQTASLRLAPQYRYADNQPPALSGYQATNSVTVRLRDLARAGGVVDALVAAGANQIDGPALSVDQPDAALDEARAAAIATARARATLYARAAGLSVGRIVSIEEDGSSTPPIVRPMAMMALRKADATPIEAGEQALTATVRVIFELK